MPGAAVQGTDIIGNPESEHLKNPLRKSQAAFIFLIQKRKIGLRIFQDLNQLDLMQLVWNQTVVITGLLAQKCALFEFVTNLLHCRRRFLLLLELLFKIATKVLIFAPIIFCAFPRVGSIIVQFILGTVEDLVIQDGILQRLDCRLQPLQILLVCIISFNLSFGKITFSTAYGFKLSPIPDFFGSKDQLQPVPQHLCQLILYGFKIILQTDFGKFFCSGPYSKQIINFDHFTCQKLQYS